MPQIRGIKGEAIVIYRESLTTQERRYHPAKGGKGKQHGVFQVSLDFTLGDIQAERQKQRRALLLLPFHTFRRVVYATVGFNQKDIAHAKEILDLLPDVSPKQETA